MGKTEHLRQLFRSLPSAHDHWFSMTDDEIMKVAMRYQWGPQMHDADIKDTRDVLWNLILDMPGEALRLMLGDLYSRSLETLLATWHGPRDDQELTMDEWELLTSLRAMGLATFDGHTWQIYREVLRIGVGKQDTESEALQMSDACYIITNGVMLLAGPMNTEQILRVMYGEHWDRLAMTSMDEDLNLAHAILMARSGLECMFLGIPGIVWYAPVEHHFEEKPRMAFAQKHLWRQLQYKAFTVHDAEYRTTVGFVHDVRAFEQLFETLYPGVYAWRKFFREYVQTCSDRVWDGFWDTLDAHPEIRMLHRHLRKLTFEISSGLPGVREKEAILKLAREACADDVIFQRSQQLLECLEDQLPRWAYRGWSEQEIRENRAIRQHTIREAERESMPASIRFRQMCPCGSGKIYGLCHGGVQ